LCGASAPHRYKRRTGAPKAQGFWTNLDEWAFIDVAYLTRPGRSSPPPSAARKRAPHAGSSQTGRPISAFFFFFFLNLNICFLNLNKNSNKFEIRKNSKYEQI
jgi:hypothetical protein